jgi:hypothetical protein
MGKLNFSASILLIWNVIRTAQHAPSDFRIMLSKSFLQFKGLTILNQVILCSPISLFSFYYIQDLMHNVKKFLSQACISFVSSRFSATLLAVNHFLRCELDAPQYRNQHFHMKLWQHISWVLIGNLLSRKIIFLLKTDSPKPDPWKIAYA